MVVKKKILYLSYDGMTDALGQSQVLSYLKGMSSQYEIYLISFEKKENFILLENEIKKICLDTKINWFPLSYTKRPPILSTMIDLLRMWKYASRYHKKLHIDIVHCRSYIPAIIGNRLKKKFGVKFIFDIRGFWIDERIDGGIWNPKNIVYQLIIKSYRKLENMLFVNANFVVSLTNVGKDYILKKYKLKEEKIGVIPTCVDQKKFTIDRNISLKDFEELKEHNGKKILLYSGALGTKSYDAKIVDFVFEKFTNHFKNTLLIILTKEQTCNLDSLKNNIILKNVPHSEVNKWLNIADYGLIFYNNGFSNIGRNPTKLGEYLAAGLKTISIGSYGDVDENAIKHQFFNLKSIEYLNWNEIEKYFMKNKLIKEEIRSKSLQYYSLKRGISFYDSIYKSI